VLLNDSGDKIVNNEVSKGVDGILANLFRTILYKHGVNTMKFNRLLERYINKTYKTITSKEATSVRGNLRKELLKNKMSWKVFLKGLYFLNIVKFDLVLKLHDQNGNVVIHEKTIVLKDQEMLEDE